MAKFIPDAVLDLILADIATSTVMHACSGQPSTFAGIAAVSLADVAMTAGNGNDYTIADDTTGRKVTTAAKNSVTVDNSGNATHVALATGSVLKAVTTCSTAALTAAGQVNFPAWKINVQDVT